MTRRRRVREQLASLLAPTDQPHDIYPLPTPNEAIPPDLLAELEGGGMVSADGRTVPRTEPPTLPAKPWILTPYAGEHDRMALEHARSIAEAMRQATTNQLDHPRDPHDYARQMDSLVQQLGHALTPAPA